MAAFEPSALAGHSRTRWRRAPRVESQESASGQRIEATRGRGDELGIDAAETTGAIEAMHDVEESITLPPGAPRSEPTGVGVPAPRKAGAGGPCVRGEARLGRRQRGVVQAKQQFVTDLPRRSWMAGARNDVFQRSSGTSLPGCDARSAAHAYRLGLLDGGTMPFIRMYVTRLP